MLLFNVIAINWLLSVGFLPCSSVTIDENTVSYNSSFIQTFGVDFNIAKTLRIFTTVDIRETKSRLVYFSPYRADFFIGAELNYKGFELGITHECNHDIIAGGITGNEINSYAGWDGVCDTVYSGWTTGYHINRNILLSPKIYLGYKPDDRLAVKANSVNTENYFDRRFFYGNYRNNLFGKMGVQVDLYKFLNIGLLFQPEYSCRNNEWSTIKGGATIEARYKNMALGADFKMEKMLVKTGYAVNEIVVYVSFRGKDSLL